MNKACEVLDSTDPNAYIDENEFIDASRLVYDAVREVRKAVLTNRVRMGAWLTLVYISYSIIM